MRPDEIYLAHFPFGDVAARKLRPVLTLTSRVGSPSEVVVAYVSSVIPAAPLPSDILVDPKRPEFASTNLKAPSVIRLHKLATIHATSIVRRLGELPASLVSEVDLRLRALLGL